MSKQKIISNSFKKWLNGIKDPIIKARIVARIDHLMEGLHGDVKPVGLGVSELRLHFGAGYRVYYHEHGQLIVVLLTGGDKSSQKRDIKRAHEILDEWRRENG